MRKTTNGIPSRSGERGVQLVEVAIALPFLFALMAAIAEFGNYFHEYTTLAKATRAASRHLSSNLYSTVVKAEARNLAVCGNAAGCADGTEILPGLTTTNIEITHTGVAHRPSTVTARIINYPYQSVFNLSAIAGSQSWLGVTVNPSTTMRYTIEN